MFFLSFLRFRVVSGGFGRAIAPLARSPWYFAASYSFNFLLFFLLFFVCSGSFWMGKKISKSMPITLRKYANNPPQPPQNLSQNLPKSSPRRSKIEVWRGFRWKSLFDPKLSPLFSAPGGRLGASWGRLGRVLGPKMVPSWNQNRIKIDVKIDQKSFAR